MWLLLVLFYKIRSSQISKSVNHAIITNLLVFFVMLLLTGLQYLANCCNAWNNIILIFEPVNHNILSKVTNQNYEYVSNGFNLVSYRPNINHLGAKLLMSICNVAKTSSIFHDVSNVSNLDNNYNYMSKHSS